MGMKPYKKAVATTGTYQDRATGQEKKRYTTIGTLFQYDDGGLALKLDAIPVGNTWNGFVSFYDLDERGASPPGEGTRSNAPSGSAGRKSSFDVDDSDIPF